MKTKQIKLKKLSDEVLSNGTKIVVLGDKPTNGDALAVAFGSFSEDKTQDIS